MQKNTGMNKNTLGSLFLDIGRVAFAVCETADYRFSKIAVDETYFGKRKYNKGKRMRKRAFWFATATEILSNGKSGRTHWKLVKRRDLGTLTAFVEEHLQSAKSVTLTDFHKGYNTLSTICHHRKVNHSIEWVTDEGWHTNNAEGAHSAVKRLLKKTSNKFGDSSRTLRRKVALAWLLVHLDGEWARKLQVILLSMRNHGDTLLGEDDLESVSADEMEETETPNPKFKKKRRTEVQRLRGSISPRKPEKVKPVSDKETVETKLKSDNQRDAIHVWRQSALNSLLPGKPIEGDVLWCALSSDLPKMWKLVDLAVVNGRREAVAADCPKDKTLAFCVNYAGHWILGVASYGDKYIGFYDSLRHYAHDERAVGIARVEHIMQKMWKTQKSSQIKHSEQQEAGSNDCGVYVINNALRLSNANILYDRNSLINMVNVRMTSTDMFPGTLFIDEDADAFFHENPGVVRSK